MACANYFQNESSHDDSGSIYGWNTIFKWILSKEMFLDALTQTGQLSQFSLISMIAIVFVGVIASVFTFTYALYMVKEVFWTKYDSKVLLKISTNHGCLVYHLFY